MDGMRKLPSCCRGAFSSASSWEKPGLSASSRMTLERLPMGWNVGSTPSRSYSVMGLRLSTMALRSAVICATSSSVSPMRVYSAMPRTSRSVRCWVIGPALSFAKPPLAPSAANAAARLRGGENVTGP